MVSVDLRGEFVSIDARGVSLGAVLDALAARLDVAIDVAAPVRERIVSIEADHLTREGVFERVLDGLGYALMYRAADAPGSRIIARVVVFGPGQATPPVDSPEEPDPVAELLRAVFERRQRDATTRATELAASLSAERRRYVAGHLRVLATDPHFEGRQVALIALRALDPATAAAVVRELVQDSDGGIRALAVGTMAAAGDPSAMPTLMQALGDADPRVRSTAARWLASTGGEAGVKFLVEAAVGSEPAIRSAAAKALAFSDDDRARVALAEAIGRGQIADEALPREVLQELVKPRRRSQ